LCWKRSQHFEHDRLRGMLEQAPLREFQPIMAQIAWYRQDDLLAENTCANTVNQQDAALACQNNANHIPLRMVNQNITVTDPDVLDSTHDWTKIHPVYSFLSRNLRDA